MTDILKSLTDRLTITEYHDWLTFVERLNDAVASGQVRRVPVLKHVYLKTEEWFLDPATQQIYVYVAPDAPILPKWERVDVLKHLEEHSRPPLSDFPTGQLSVMTAYMIKAKLEDLISHGLAQELHPPRGASYSAKGTERWFKDNESNAIYRLSEYYGLNDDADDIRWDLVAA